MNKLKTNLHVWKVDTQNSQVINVFPEKPIVVQLTDGYVEDAFELANNTKVFKKIRNNQKSNETSYNSSEEQYKQDNWNCIYVLFLIIK